MFRISQEYESVRLFIVSPRLVLFFATDESIKQMRDILRVCWEEGGRRVTELVPELKTHKLVASSDGELRGLLKSNFKNAFITNFKIS